MNINIEDIEVFIGIDVDKERALGHSPEPGGTEGCRQGSAQRQHTRRLLN